MKTTNLVAKMTKQTKEQIQKRQHIWYILNRDRILPKKRKYQYDYSLRPTVKLHHSEYAKQPRVKEREAARRKNPKYHTILLMRDRQWRESKHGRDYRYGYARMCFRTNAQFRIRTLLRNRLRVALQLYGLGKCLHSEEYNIDFTAIIKHLGAMPNDGRKYHIDHIIPLCFFDLTNPDEIKRAFAPENHQWLPDVENLAKNARWVDQDGNLRFGKKLLQENFIVIPRQEHQLVGIDGR